MITAIGLMRATLRESPAPLADVHRLYFGCAMHSTAAIAALIATFSAVITLPLTGSGR